MARREVVGGHLAERRLVQHANLLRVVAARVEAAARRRGDRAGDIPRQDHARLLSPRVRDGGGREQRLGVGVERDPVEGLGVGQFRELSQVHHGHAVADVLHNAQVVGNEQVGQAKLLLEVLEEIDHLPPDRDVEGGDRLVADDQLRIQGQSPCDADPLALAAGELVWVAPHVLFLQPHNLQQFEDPGLPLLPVRHAVDEERLPDDVGDVLAGVDKMGISSVPTFVFNDQTVVGAQPYEVLEQFLRENGVKRKG